MDNNSELARPEVNFGSFFKNNEKGRSSLTPEGKRFAQERWNLAVGKAGVDGTLDGIRESCRESVEALGKVAGVPKEYVGLLSRSMEGRLTHLEGQKFLAEAGASNSPWLSVKDAVSKAWRGVPSGLVEANFARAGVAVKREIGGWLTEKGMEPGSIDRDEAATILLRETAAKMAAGLEGKNEEELKAIREKGLGKLFGDAFEEAQKTDLAEAARINSLAVDLTVGDIKKPSRTDGTASWRNRAVKAGLVVAVGVAAWMVMRGGGAGSPGEMESRQMPEGGANVTQVSPDVEAAVALAGIEKFSEGLPMTERVIDINEISSHPAWLNDMAYEKGGINVVTLESFKEYFVSRGDDVLKEPVVLERDRMFAQLTKDVGDHRNLLDRSLDFDKRFGLGFGEEDLAVLMTGDDLENKKPEDLLRTGKDGVARAWVVTDMQNIDKAILKEIDAYLLRVEGKDPEDQANQGRREWLFERVRKDLGIKPLKNDGDWKTFGEFKANETFLSQPDTTGQHEKTAEVVFAYEAEKEQFARQDLENAALVAMAIGENGELRIEVFVLSNTEDVLNPGEEKKGRGIESGGDGGRFKRELPFAGPFVDVAVPSGPLPATGGGGEVEDGVNVVWEEVKDANGNVVIGEDGKPVLRRSNPGNTEPVGRPDQIIDGQVVQVGEAPPSGDTDEKFNSPAVGGEGSKGASDGEKGGKGGKP